MIAYVRDAFLLTRNCVAKATANLKFETSPSDSPEYIIWAYELKCADSSANTFKGRLSEPECFAN